MLNDVVSKFIARENLLQKDCNYLVALSGGADSVALLRVLISLGYKVEAVHCNFHLRAEESDNDENFCKELCSKNNIPLHLAHFDTLSYADLHHVSIEMAARDLRYNYFEQLRKDLSMNAVCVAHHKDDSVETVLLNLIRGTGINGLKGIVPKNGNVVRPLLCVSKSEIECYLDTIKQDYVTDRSNLIDDVQRNKVRLNIIPMLQEINSSASENIFKASEKIQNILPIIDESISRSKARVSVETPLLLRISINLLLQEKSPEVLLWSMLKGKGFSSPQVYQIFENLTAQSGREWNSPSHVLVFDRGFILVEPATQKVEFEKQIPEEGKYVFNEKYKVEVLKKQVDESFIIDKSLEKISLDFDKVEFPLTIRNVRMGDWFIPFGMTGKKLISDFLTDRKLSLLEKRRQLVIADRNGSVVWVVGLRPDNRFCITSDTSNSLLISFSVCS